MAYVIVGALLVAAVAVLTLPWSRRDPAGFTRPELGYAWRGERGAVRAALGVLSDQGFVRARRGKVTRRDKKMTRGGDPFVRAVFAALGPTEGDVFSLLEAPAVREHLTPVADRVIGARLRVGAPRRAAGSALAFASPVIALVALAHGVGSAVAGVITSVVAVLVAIWLFRLHGVTIAGARTLAGAPADRTRRPDGEPARVSSLSSGVGWLFAPTDFGLPGGGFDGGIGSGGDGGGGDGGGSV